jgi:exonuclease 3'-5' domain-containing protein 1
MTDSRFFPTDMELLSPEFWQKGPNEIKVSDIPPYPEKWYTEEELWETLAPSVVTVNDVEGITSMMNGITMVEIHRPSYFLDLEGQDLGRDGTLDILQLYHRNSHTTYLIRIHKLGHDAFDTPGTETAMTLRGLLENEFIPKVLFDVRNDSDALFGLFGVKLRCVRDLQLMEVAARSGNKKRLNGLQACLLNHGPLSGYTKRCFNRVKAWGRRQMNENPTLFIEEPMSPRAQEYCAQDVQYLPWLYKYYSMYLNETWWQMVLDKSKQRVEDSWRESYAGSGYHKRLSPMEWQWLRTGMQRRRFDNSHGVLSCTEAV